MLKWLYGSYRNRFVIWLYSKRKKWGLLTEEEKIGSERFKREWADIEDQAERQIDQEYKPWSECHTEKEKRWWAFQWHFRCKELYREMYPFKPSA